MLLLIDNYDSFTYNLYQYLCELGEGVIVVRNDELTVKEIKDLSPSHIISSPGPSIPQRAGVCCEVVKELGNKIPILGVCLGHQCIAHAFGGVVERAGEIMHGKTSLIYHHGRGIFKGLPNPFTAVRYHSLIVRRESLPRCLEVTAWTDKGLIMGLEHKSHPIIGVQFHPESILTANGKDLLRNFLQGET